MTPEDYELVTFDYVHPPSFNDIPISERRSCLTTCTVGKVVVFEASVPKNKGWTYVENNTILHGVNCRMGAWVRRN